MKKLSLCIILFGLLSTSQAGENYYVPIHNLAPLGYNPLTTNYNPDYDNYTGLISKQSQANNQQGSVNTQLAQLEKELQGYRYAMYNDDAGNVLYNARMVKSTEEKIKQLNNQYTNHVNDMVDATSLKDSVRNSALASQDRFQINQISGSGGCGSRGGPGYRKANGQCASWSD